MSPVGDMISCREFVELVTSYAEGDAAPGRRNAFEQHMLVCPPCRIYQRQMSQTTQLLARLGEDPGAQRDGRRPAAAATTTAAASEPEAQTGTRRALKCLGAGRLAPISGVRWPAPGAAGAGDWVRAEGRLEACVNGVHACRLEDLPHWLDDELWLVELAGVATDSPAKLVAARGRLVAPVRGWDEAAKGEFADACTIAARDAARTVLGEEGKEEADALAALALPELADRATRGEAGAADPRVRAAYSYLGVAAAYRDDPAIAAFAAAVAGGHAYGDEGAARERDRQVRWLDERLELGKLLAGA